MGKSLIKKIFKGDTVTWMIFAVLCAISLVEVFSATSRLTPKYISLWGPIMGHAKFLLLGIFAAWAVHNMPMVWFKKATPYIYILFTALLIYGTFFGEEKNDATRWIKIAGYSIQPSEFAKIGLLMLVSRFIADWQEERETAVKTLRNIVIATLGVCGFIVTNNLSTTLIILFTIYLMLLLAKLPGKLMAKFTLVCAILAITGATTIVMIPAEMVKDTPVDRIITWQNRIKSFLPSDYKKENKNDDGKDDQRNYANIAIASSGIIFGKGPGNSEQREYLPEAYSDLIYAIIIEEWGLIIGCIGLVVLYLTLMFHTGQIAKSCDDPFAAYLIMGAALIIGMQAMIHMSISTGLFPISGQPLPLVSRGGTSLLANSIYIGMILSVSRYAGKLKEDKEKERNSTHQKNDTNE
ncbi:MAG: FtsW/RodA/SpoVE family cell cycle protein [Bacteroidaceae bacterium]|nr:FtsW/RodA/SpoVE family cell cycle protein [Bacteroidaceae bacterium]